MPVSSQAITRTVPDTGMVDFIIVAAIWSAQNIVQEFERLPNRDGFSLVPPIPPASETLSMACIGQQVS